MKNPIRPVPLDNSVIHHPRTIRQWKDEEFAYHAAVRAQALAAERKAEEKSRPKALTEDQEFEAAVKRDSARKAQQAERAQREASKEQAHKEFLASSPERVDLLESSLYALVMSIQHWCQKGYQIDENSINSIPPSLYACQLTPALKPKKQPN